MYPLRMLDGAGAAGPAGTTAASGLPGAATAATPGLMGASQASQPTNEERLDASSDSAVSSMGSERVASLSDGGEWMETSSDSEHYHLDCKYRGPAGAVGAVGMGHEYSGHHAGYSPHRVPPASVPAGVAQKKHQMFGKRYFQGEQATGTFQGQAASRGVRYGREWRARFGAVT